jgi:hypothetical protein
MKKNVTQLGAWMATGLLTLLVACNFTKTPKKAFSENHCPVQPDYSQLESWAAHPDKVDPADKTPVPNLVDGQAGSAVDIFFLHPTTHLASKDWNADVTYEKLNQRTDRTAIKHQASIFNGAGRVYAPRYRQVILGAFYDDHDPSSNQRAFALAYADLKAAFEYYLAHENGGRPIIVAAHSQGAAHAIHLLKDYFDGGRLQNQLVAAYIPGWPTPADTFQVLQPCSSPDQTGCYATWCSFEWGTAPKNQQWYRRAVVVNPVTWRMDTVSSSVAAHRGTVMGGYDTVYPKALEAKVAGHILWVKRPNVKGTNIIRGNNFHIADFNLFWQDVRENAILRAGKYLEAHPAGK